MRSWKQKSNKMKKDIQIIAKEIRIFVQTTSSVGDKNNAEYIERRISEEIANMFVKNKEKIFNRGVIMGMVLGIGLSIIVAMQYFL